MSTALVPVPEATVDELHLRLRAAILGNELGAREELSQVELARRLGVSTTPVREALRMLQREGLVRVERNRGFRVADLSIGDMEDLYAVRIPLERTAVRLTVPVLADEELAALEGLYAQMAFFAERLDADRYAAPHRAFHAALGAAAGPRLRATLDELADHAERYRHAYTAIVPAAWDVAQAEHRAILDAVVARDADRAAGLLGDHLARTVHGVIAAHAPHHDLRALRVVLGQGCPTSEGAPA